MRDIDHRVYIIVVQTILLLIALLGLAGKQYLMAAFLTIFALLLGLLNIMQ